MTTTTSLPLTLPAAALAVGDTIYSADGTVLGGTIAELATPDGEIELLYTDGTRGRFTRDCLVTVTSRRPIPALNDLTTSLTALVEQWERMADTRQQALKNRVEHSVTNGGHYGARVYAEERQLRACAAEVREILDRLGQPA